MKQTARQVTSAGFYSRVLTLISLTLIVTSLQAQDTSTEARNLINAMSSASRSLNYDATFVYRKGNQMDVMRLIHKANDGDEIERLVSLTGHAREVIRDKNSVTCIFPDNQAVMVEKSKPRKLLSGQLPEPIEKIAGFYSFSVAGTDRVLGRDTWIVNIIPKDEFRYGYQIWIDKDSNLSLKTELKTRSGTQLEQILFTQLQIMDDMPDHMLEPSIIGSGYTWYNHTYDKVESHGKTSQWVARWMPGGFSMSDHEQQTVSSSEMPVDHLIYSDGLATVSVFVEKIGEQPLVTPGPSQMGGVNAFATLAAGYQVTAVGEVPMATVKQMAKSVAQK